MIDEAPRRGRKRTVRAEAILDSALLVLASEGLDAVTLGRVAREVDLVPAALYRYFPSKDAMLAALQRKVLSDVLAQFHEAHAAFSARIGKRRSSASVASLVEVLFLVELYLDLPTRLPGHHGLIAAFLGDPRLLLPEEEARKSAPLFALLFAEIEARLRAATGTAALGSGDSLERALVLWAAVQGALLLGKLTRYEPVFPQPKAIGGAAVTALLRGWGAVEKDLRAAQRLLASSSLPHAIAEDIPGPLTR